MTYKYTDAAHQALFYLTRNEPRFERYFFRERKESLLTIAWNRGDAQKITIDEVVYDFPANGVAPLMVNQTFTFEKPENIIAWQFNRDFYCIINHDAEVSCVGFLFYGSKGIMFIQPDKEYTRKLESLLQVFMDEFEEKDAIQGEMMQMLLKRLIILLTRMGKTQHLAGNQLDETDFTIVREFNLLVENNYRTLHQVQDYAQLLNKTPKTLSNLFLNYNNKSPLTIIHERIVLEAKRLFYYTDKTAKEIAYELGFEDPANFSRFFKSQTGQSPSEFKNKKLSLAI